MIYLSWDIGIVNLSLCMVKSEEDKLEIIKWENINLSLNTSKKYECCGIMKNSNKCKKVASYYSNDEAFFYCKKHKLDKSLEMKDKKCVVDKCKRNKKYFSDKFLLGYCKVHKEEYGKDIELKEKSKDSVFELISEKLIIELNKRPYLLESDIVVIENQPAIKNPKMKSIQMIIYSYFLIKGKMEKKIDKISFLLATNKLKVKLLDKKNNELLSEQVKLKYKDKYKQRKELSKLYTLNVLNTFNIKDCEIWKNFFNESKKKDDLADTLLMNIFMIQKK